MLGTFCQFFVNNIMALFVKFMYILDGVLDGARELIVQISELIITVL